MGKLDEFRDSVIFPDMFKNTLTEDKKCIFSMLCSTMLMRTLGMFKYEGLPETLKKRSMEIGMQTRGFCAITKVDNPAHGESGIYCIRESAPAGLLNDELLPTQIVSVDPWLNFNKTMTIDEDCVVIPNDSLWMGLGGISSLFAGQLADAETTMRLQLYNARTSKILTATDDKVVDSAETLLKTIKDGGWGVIGDSVELKGMMKALSSVDFTSPHSGSIKDTMEVLQYYRAQWFIALGLNDNFNMKREALNGTETESNANTLFALPLEMLKARQEGCERLNKLFNLNVSVEFDGVWKTAYEKYLLSLKVQEKEAENMNKEPQDENSTDQNTQEEDTKDE